MCPRIEYGLVMLVSASLILGVAACASNPAPDDWLPSATDVPTEPFGAWIQLDIRDADAERRH